MSHSSPSVPSLGLKLQPRKKRSHGRLNSNGNELELWQKFINNENDFLSSDSNEPVLNFRAPYHFLPIDESIIKPLELQNISGTTIETEEQNKNDEITEGVKIPKQSYHSKSKSENQISFQSQNKTPAERNETLKSPLHHEKIRLLRSKKIDLKTYNKWQADIFRKIRERIDLSEEAKSYFTCREEQLLQNQQPEGSTFSDENNNMKVQYNTIILGKQGNRDGVDSIGRRKHVSGSHLDISRIEFEISQQEKHKELQEEAIRISIATNGSLTPKPQRTRNTIEIPRKVVQKSNSQKALKVHRATSGSGDEKTLLPALSLPPTPPPRSRISRHSSSSLLTDALVSPTGKLKPKETPIAEQVKSPKRDQKKKSLKSFIKTLEKSVVQSPRKVKKSSETSRAAALPVDLSFPDFRTEGDDDILDDSASFILSPKSKNAAMVRPRKKLKDRKSANRARSMSLCKNEGFQIVSNRSESDGEGVFSAPETTLSSLAHGAESGEAEDEKTEPEDCADLDDIPSDQLTPRV